MLGRLAGNGGETTLSDLTPDLWWLPRSAAQWRLFEQLVPKDISSGTIPRRRELGSVPVSFVQARLWILEQLDPDVSLYHHIPLVLRLSGRLDLSALAWSINEIVQRHEVLRTAFAMVAGQLMQVVAPTCSLSLPLIELGAGAVDADGELWTVVHTEVRRPFDLAQAPLIRACVFRERIDEHVLVVTLHRAVADDVSVAVFMRELVTLYSAATARKHTTLPGLPVQYADYACWQRSQLAEERLIYWRDMLAPISDRSHWGWLISEDSSGRQLQRGVSHTFRLPLDLVERLRQLSKPDTGTMDAPRELASGILHRVLERNWGRTLATTWLAAFYALLYRLHGFSDPAQLVIGTQVAGRTCPELEGLIGPLSNTLALRVNVSGDPTFLELLARVRMACWEAYQHQGVPFEYLLDHLLLPAEVSGRARFAHAPLFPATFAIRERLLAIELADLHISPLDYLVQPLGVVDSDLLLELIVEPGTLSARFVGGMSSCDALIVRRMAEHFQTLLEGISIFPDQRLSTLPVMSEAERHQLLVTWNDTSAVQTGDLSDCCLHECFEAQVDRTPDAVALFYEGEQLTYAALDAQANQVAHRLQQLGIGPEQRVGLCAERSIELVVGILGILKAGGTYVPLDPAYPRERLAFMLADAQVPVLLTQERLKDRLPAQGMHVICLDAGQTDQPTRCDRPRPASYGWAGNLAYVMYTSGSTGQPKGVCCTHVGVNNLLADFQRRRPIAVGDRCSVWTSVSFDVSVYEIFSALTAGGTLYIVPEHLRADSIRFFQWLHAHKIGSAYIPPFMLADLAHWLDQEAEQLSLFRLLVGVEPISESLLISLARRLPNLCLINGYGPTETTICATLYEIDPASSYDRRTPIGRPIQRAAVYVLDGHLQPVPVGAIGELYIGGAGLARGYLNRPGLTAGRFLPAPFGSEPGARLYKTGDLVRYLPDGHLQFFGRVDDQVKIHGFRVELGEIEAAIRTYPGVRGAVAVLREVIRTTGGPSSKAMEKRLVAYIVPEHGALVSVPDLRSYLRERLPAHVIPTAFVLLETLPLSPNGKLDRRALPDPEWGSVQDDAFVAPCTPTETALAAIWAEVLALPAEKKIGIRDDFFALGGHSLLAVQMLSRLRTRLGVEIPLHTVFEASTVAELASYIDKICHASGSGVAGMSIQTQARHAANLSDLLTQIEQLSDAEVAALFAADVDLQ